MDRVSLRAWTDAVAAWSAGPELPVALRPQAFGLAPPGEAVPQLPWGPAAAEALRVSQAFGPYLDHTLLRPDAVLDEVRQLGEEARAHHLGGACVHPIHVSVLVEALGRSPAVPIAVVGFPHGAHLSAVKAHEAQGAITAGARELDVVAALGALRAGDVEAALDDMWTVVQASRPWPVKLILETGLLERRAVVLGAGLAMLAGCAAVKTSTGFGGPGARVEDVTLLRAVVGADLQVKASGGIRTREQALALVRAGASRLGTSASVSLVRGD